MRFGLNYHQYQVPEWAPYYVPYPLLKRLLKTAIRTVDFTERQPDFADVYSRLECSIHCFSDFHHENYVLLRQRREEISKRLDPEANTLTGARCSSLCELENVFKAVLELRKDSEKLQWYYRVNKEAVRRIDGGPKAKWVKLEADRDVSWLKYTGSLNELMGSIIQIRSDMKFYSNTKSCLENVSSHHSPSSDPIRALDHAVMNDDAQELSKVLDEMYSSNATTRQCFQEIVCGLAGRSVIYRSKRSAILLLSEAFPKYHITPDHRILNRMIITSGRQLTTGEHTTSKMCSQCSSRDFCGKPESNLFSLVVQQLALGEKSVLLEKDAFGRLPLHYSAIYGLPDICELLLDFSQKSGQEYPEHLIMSLDSQRYTPLHYAVINNHALVTKAFLKALEPMRQTSDKARNHNLICILNDLLVIAIKHQYDDLVRLLAKFPLESHGEPSHGETALYVAARSGNEVYVDILLEHGRYPDLDTPETVHGWTPLFIACVEGHHAVAKILLNAAAKQDVHDYSGWTAKEHAAVRGHLTLAGMLTSLDTEDPLGGPASTFMQPILQNTMPFRTDCHYLIINLGVLQSGKQVKAVELRDRSPTELIAMNAGFLMEISTSERESKSQLVELPLLTDMTHEPFIFPVTDPDRAWISFKLLQASSTLTKGRNLLGGGTALIGSSSDYFGKNRESLIRERTVPILEKDTLDVLGKVTFTFVISKLISHRAGPLGRPLVTEEGVQLVGHREYPRLHEAIDAGVAPVAIEINTFIDKALEKLFSYGNKKRTIILSSFTPEICILLAIKQQTYPVMFITNAGKPPVADRELRAASIQSAVRFARRWKLSGLVFASEALVMCPRLVRYVQESGLICGSYGSQNNIPENAKYYAHLYISCRTPRYPSIANMSSKSQLTYSARASKHPNALVKKLFEVAEAKKTNVTVSADVTTTKELLDLADRLGPYIAVIKTHIDILSDFSEETITGLKALAEKHNFLIFEDRKFIDIGNTVQKQYHGGTLRISEWAHIINCSILPGEGIVEALAQTASAEDFPYGSERGLLILAEMTSKGSLATGQYTTSSVDYARKYKEFVMGFVSTRHLGEVQSEVSSPSEDEDFVVFTTGVNLSSKGDKLGQQYQTPESAVGRGADFIIAGRGIYAAPDPVEAARRYQKEGWDAYMKRVGAQ
ncbi:humps family-domain-containing protein [Aspergillus pseudotamarii]|uniref:Orotidine 5'-phosphate decarboxylase n=3 Tax=Aspergillus subgen. Circumdati TaxID=2720871 RepID=A0A5N6SUE0_ASPPS|nr:humps family-domain-containing protein [Aspergillus pseudotamarii]KAE8138298.1 humps family-domain-containing protein [Aspergillus pseudotamarii]